MIVNKNTSYNSNISFADLLRAELLTRCRANPSYSLRAFAKHLNIAAPTLSRILNKKRNPSKSFILKVASTLNLSYLDVSRYFNHNAEEEQAGIKYTEQDIISQIEIISNWVHYAIFELTETNGFNSNPKLIAQRLGITKFEAEVAIDNLIKAKFLKLEDKQLTKNIKNISTTQHQFTTLALKQVQKEFLKIATRSIDTIDYELREQATMTMPIDTRMIPEAKMKFKEFRRKMNKFFSQSKSPDQVYNLTVSFYPLTNLKETK